MDMKDKAVIQVDNKVCDELPVLKASIGPDVVDVTKLYRDIGMFTYDPGFMSTASCQSKITYIDGEAGILMHRGYSIQDLASKSDYMEVAYLLLHGELPNTQQKTKFIFDIKHHTMVHEQLHHLFRGFLRKAHPMAMLSGAFSSLSAVYHDNLDISDAKQREEAAIQMIAKIPTLAAMAYKYSIGQPFMYPRNDLSYSENFLYMMYGVPSETYHPNPIIAKALDKLLILHADHEQNASTSTVRLAGSSGANPFACISAGIASLWGPAHGGANEAVIKMLRKIEHPSNIPKFIEMAKDKESGFKLMGFGHRVYKNYDPRAAVLRESCYEVLKELNKDNEPLLDIAMELERIALSDEYFIERKLFPNVDFYSGIIYQAMGIPAKMFTVLFATARVSGWIAQWKEMMEDPTNKIGRPRQLYTGYTKREFLNIDQRK